MRELKFRVWDKGFSKYVHKDTLGKIRVAMNGEVFFEDDGNWKSDLPDPWFILEQFTGLQDSKGKDIYEGDIIITNNRLMDVECDLYPANEVCEEIVYNQHDCAFCRSNQWVLSLAHLSKYPSTIIGNINQNPEIL